MEQFHAEGAQVPVDVADATREEVLRELIGQLARGANDQPRTEEARVRAQKARALRMVE